MDMVCRFTPPYGPIRVPMACARWASSHGLRQMGQLRLGVLIPELGDECVGERDAVVDAPQSGGAIHVLAVHGNHQVEV